MRMKQTWLKQRLHLGLGFHQKSSEVEELEVGYVYIERV